LAQQETLMRFAEGTMSGSAFLLVEGKVYLRRGD